MQGYYTNRRVLREPKAIPFDLRYTVVYYALGRVIPVDEQDQPFPRVDHPRYANDPLDPTTIMTTEQLPFIPGYSAETSTVSPSDLSADTKIVYRNRQTKDEVEQPVSTAPASPQQKPAKAVASEAETSQQIPTSQQAVPQGTVQKSTPTAPTEVASEQNLDSAEQSPVSETTETTAASKKPAKENQPQSSNSFFGRLRSRFGKKHN